jgi:beta-lactamase class A
MVNDLKAGARLCAFLVLALGTNAYASPSCDLNHGLEKIVSAIVPQKLISEETSYGLELVDTRTGETLCDDYVEGDQNVYPASTIKTLIAFAALRQVDQGELRLDQEITINQPNNPVECADWNCDVYGNGKKVTLEKLLSDMITISNNLAANQLIDVTGRVYITDTAKLLGAPSLAVYRKVYNEQDPEPGITQHNTATARGYVALFHEIVSGHLGILSSASRALLIDDLRQQHYHDDFDHDFYPQVTFYHKDGATSQMRGDTGFYYLGSDKNVAAILVGLQNFPNYSDCTSGKCVIQSSDYALSQIGAGILKLTSSLRSLDGL